MHSRRRASVLLAVLVAAALVLITVDFRTGAAGGGPLGTLRGLTTTVLGPVQEATTAVVRPIADALGGVGEMWQVHTTNQRLRAQLDEVGRRHRSLADLQRENAELRRLLALPAAADHDVVVARTIALGPSNFEWTITVDAGSGDGIARDMVVVNGDGLVGRVVQATPDAARVLLAVDPNFSAAARLASSGETGTVDGRGSDPMLFRPLDPEAPVAVGDEVVTSSYAGGVFPPGIPIGTVAAAGAPTSQLTRDVLVRPFVDFTRLDHVAVLRTSPVAVPSTPEEGEEASASGRSSGPTRP